MSQNIITTIVNDTLKLSALMWISRTSRTSEHGNSSGPSTLGRRCFVIEMFAWLSTQMTTRLQ